MSPPRLPSAGPLGPLDFFDAPPRSGGQAYVYKARLRDSGAHVAVKVAKPEPRAMRGVAQEVEELGKLHRRDARARRWVVPLLWSGRTADDLPFMVLPWADESLHDWVNRVRPGLPERLAVLRQCAAIVVRLHRSGPAPTDDELDTADLDAGLAQVMVHRDLKPPNFLVSYGIDLMRIVRD